MKKTFLVLIMVVVFTISSMVFAGDLLQLTAYVAPFRVIVNNVEKEFENPIVTVNDRTYVPLREVGEALGMNVEWDGENQKIIIGNYQNTPQEWETVYRFRQDDLWGYKDADGNVVIEPQFVFTREFSEGLAFVSRSFDVNEEMRGYIDLTGNLIIPLPDVVPERIGFESFGFSAFDFSEGFARVVVRAWNFPEWGNDIDGVLGITGWRGPTIFIDRTGQNAFGQEFATARDFQNGYAEVTLLDGTRTHINRQGNIVQR